MERPADHQISAKIPERFPARDVADARQRRTHVGAGARDGSGVPLRRNTGFVVGGSRAFAEAIADRYGRLGGVIRYNTRVVRSGSKTTAQQE